MGLLDRFYICYNILGKVSRLRMETLARTPQDLVGEIVDPLCVLFKFFELDSAVREEIVDAFLKGRVI